MKLLGLSWYTDAQILEGLAKHDNTIVRYVYKKYYAQVADYVYKNSGTQDDAQDIFQEGMLIFMQKVKQPDFNLSEASPKTYLYRICANLWLERLRKDRRKLQRESVYAYWEGESTAPDSETDSWFSDTLLPSTEELLQAVGDKCRDILMAYYYQKMSMVEIAQKYEYKDANSAKNQKYKCLQRIKANVEKIYPQAQL